MNFINKDPNSLCSQIPPMDRIAIKIPGKNKRDSSKAAVAARKLLVYLFSNDVRVGLLTPKFRTDREAGLSNLLPQSRYPEPRTLPSYLKMHHENDP